MGIERLKFAAILFAAALLAGGCRAGAIPRARAGAQRIVSLAPSVTESLFAIGAGAQVVGVSQYCDYPPAARKLPRVGTFLTPNIEAIAALRPTVVIGPLTSADLREMRALRAMGITTVAVGSDDSIAQIEHSIWQIGNQTARAGAARRLLAEIRLRMRSTQERLNGRPMRSVLMVVGHQPMVAVGRGTYLDELLALARGANIADASAQAWPRLSLEYIIASRPDVILDGQMGTDPSTPDSFWRKYPSIPAVKNHRVYGYPEDPTLHPGPRIGSTLEILARLIHPEAFPTRELPPKSMAPMGEASQ
ncbi:MAG TPA: helical backbone metal receptor [Candidatus Binataceae bacterium]|nr:helical backbone metal receptor [Candidatus Binataceae bacterium]